MANDNQAANNAEGGPTTTTTSSSAPTPLMSDEELRTIPLQKLQRVVQQLTDKIDNSTTPLTSADRVRYFRQRAQCLFRLHQNSAALADAERVLAESPGDLTGHITAGQACAAMGQFKEAFHFYKAGLQIDPNSKMLTEQLRRLHSRILDTSETASEAEPSYRALDFCTQDPYPGDDVQLRLERDILRVKHKVGDILPNEQAQDKVNKAAGVKHLKLAVQALEIGRRDEAMSQCTRTLQVDPGNVIGRHLLGQLLYDDGRLVDALRELWAIPKASRACDVWNMGGKILVSLWLPVTAEFWLRKATLTSGRKDEEAAVLFQKVRVKRLYGPLTDGFPVAVDFTQYGRAIFATKDIKAGQVLLKDLPLVHGQTLPSRYVPACSQCTRSLISATDYFGDEYESLSSRAKEVVARYWPDVTRVWCPKCDREMYCSQLCLQAAWDSHHQILCPSVNQASSKLYDIRDKDGWGLNAKGEWTELWGGHYSPFVLAKVWAAVLCHVRRLMAEAGNTGGPPTVEQWATAKAPFRRFIAFGTTPATERMPEMLAIFQEVFGSSLQEPQYPITEAEFKGRYYQAACNLQCFSAAVTPFHRFMENLKDDVEGLSVLKYLDEHKTPEPYFAGMFPVHACLNHACDNNAEVSNGQLDGFFGIQVTAKRDIKKGEEICINYIDTALPRMLRRAWLFKSFNFWCQCLRCRFEGDRPTRCTQCGAKAKADKKFPTCGKCHKAWYCSTSCQKAAWVAGHKVVCQTKHSIVASPQEYEVC